MASLKSVVFLIILYVKISNTLSNAFIINVPSECQRSFMTGRAFGRAFGPLQHASRADSTSSQKEFEEDGGDDRGDEISASVGNGNSYGGVSVLPSHPRYREEGRLINVKEGNLVLSREVRIHE